MFSIEVLTSLQKMGLCLYVYWIAQVMSLGLTWPPVVESCFPYIVYVELYNTCLASDYIDCETS